MQHNPYERSITKGILQEEAGTLSNEPTQNPDRPTMTITINSTMTEPVKLIPLPTIIIFQSYHDKTIIIWTKNLQCYHPHDDHPFQLFYIKLNDNLTITNPISTRPFKYSTSTIFLIPTNLLWIVLLWWWCDWGFYSDVHVVHVVVLFWKRDHSRIHSQKYRIRLWW